MKEFIKKRWKITAAILALVVVVIATVAIVGYIYEFSQMVYKERAYHLNETATQITETVDVALGEQWSLLQLMTIRFSSFDNLTTEECVSKITKMEKYLNKEGLIFGIVDENGNVFASSENNEVFSLKGMLKEKAEDKSLAIIKPLENSDKEYMTFVMKTTKPVTLADGRVITHSVAFLEMNSYKKIFHNDAYGEENCVFIRDNTGESIYFETDKLEFINDFNYLDIYPNVERVNGDSIEQIEENIKNNKSSVTAIKVKGDEKTYFITVQPMRNNDWDLVMVVPEEFVSAETIDFAGAILDTATFFTVIIFLGILLLVIFIVKSKSQKLLLKQEREYAEALAESAEEARNANQAKTMFLSHMSHDVRTPINGIIGMINKAERHIDEPEVLKDCHKKIRMASEHLLGLINDILDITKLETGLNEEKDEPFPMNCMLDTCCSIIKGQLENKDTELRTDFENITHDGVIGNKLHIRQILLNILSNAVKYTDNGYIYFKAEEVDFDGEKATYQFTITDTGIGMHKTYLEHIFEPFSKDTLEETEKVRLGTGLGMAIVKNNVDRLGGTITVDSTLGLGSTFTVTLSLKVTEMDTVCDVLKEKLKPSKDVSGMKVLLVEDNELNIEVALMLLEDAGVTADVAKNGEEAVEKFLASKEGDYDLILMDVMMPVMNGYEATRAIRNSDHPLSKSIPIVAQTANAFQEDIKKVKECGMNAHISKPIDETHLLEVLAIFKKN